MMKSSTLKMPEAVVERFGTVFSFKGQSDSKVCSQGLKKLMSHFVKVLYIQDMILAKFRLNETNAALDLIRQVAVFHAIIGVLPVEFRMMDYFMINYLIKNKVTNEDCVNHLIMYLSIVSNYINLFYQSQSVRFSIVNEIIDKRDDDRQSKARENFRLMKKWKKTVAGIGDQDPYIDQLLVEQVRLRKTEEDLRSIDTLTLKKHDFIMKHFTKNTPPQRSRSFSLMK